MRKLTAWLAITLGVLMFVGLHGCSEDDDNPASTPDEKTEFQLLTEYLTANDLDLPDLLDSWIVSAETVMDNGLSTYFIADIRQQADYDDGHIEGALHTSLSEIVTFEAANNTNNDPVLVVCYTGQSAGHGALALRLMGVEAQVLKWGMAGWHTDFSSRWSDKVGDGALDYPAAWPETTAPPAWGSFSDPTIATSLTSGAAIMESQLTDYVLNGFNGIQIATALGDYEDYQFVNYWPRSAWDQYGHITGAIQVGPDSLNIDTLEMLDPSKPVVVYCWTGQTASIIAGWLCLLGYDAYDLTFGANGMIYSDLQSSKWTDEVPMDYAYVTSNAEFAALTGYMEAQDLDLPKILEDAFLYAETINDVGINSYFILDLRSATDFEAGHIEDARNCTLADVLTTEDTYNKPTKKIVVACYTGQTAGHAVAAFRMLGKEAYVLAWGMAGWNSAFANKWSDNVGNAALDYTGSWTETGDPPALGTYDEPVLDTGFSEGNAILSYQITNRVLDGFNGIDIATVLPDYDEYHVINYWNVTDWDTYGHITGAYQITPDELTLDTISALDPSKDNVIYCWSGQTASLVAAWLNVLGYDAFDLKFGANGMIYDRLQAHQWSAPGTDYPYETGSGE